MKQNDWLKLFFDKIKTIGFFERIFFWKNVVNLSYDAYEEYKKISNNIMELEEKINTLNLKIKDLEKDNEHFRDSKNKIENELAVLKERYKDLEKEKRDIEKKLIEYEKIKEQKEIEYNHKIVQINTLREQLENDRKKIQEEREEEIKKHFEDMKKVWKNHENDVKETIQMICKKYNIEYLDSEKVPFKGKPDNTIKICEEYIIFDAKSPYNDDLSNFSDYIKRQAEDVKKYIKEKEVKKDIFLVIPNNTFEVVKEFFYNMGDYNVYVIGKDSLEPIILSLQKIEDYEFAEKLSPEDRDTICRVIGKFAHTTKRRIQIDNWFANEFIDLLMKCDSLPEEILEKSKEFEKSEKLNPPLEKRSKVIPDDELKKDTKKIKQRAEAENILIDDTLKQINEIPLYRED